MIAMNIKSTAKAVQAIIESNKRATKAYKAAINMEAGLIETESKKEAPVDTGNMRDATFFKTEVKNDDDGITLELGYRAEYAIFVHENPVAHHKVGKWKFLEDPLKRAEKGFGNRVAARVQRAMGIK